MGGKKCPFFEKFGESFLVIPILRFALFLITDKLKNKKEINLLFSVYDTPVNRSNKRTSNDAPIIKQNVVRQYIKNAGGVDRNDNLGGDYSSIKKSLKWRIKVALHYNQEAT